MKWFIRVKEAINKLRTSVFIFAICFSAANCIAQGNNEVLSHIPKTGRSPKDFIPKGYDTLSVANGDLNKDGISDIVMVLSDVREDTADMDTEIDRMKRVLIILFRTSTGWELAGRSGNIILCQKCGGIYGDPFSTMEVANNVLTIQHYGGSNWRWTYTHKFRYQSGDFFLIGKTTDAYSVFGGCDTIGMANKDFEDINFITGTRVQMKISEDCKILVDKTDKIKTKPLIRLSEVKTED